MQNRYNMAQDLRISLRGFGARSAFGIRGIKVIVDGIPETLPDGQAGVDSIDLGSASRIQVMRDRQSARDRNLLYDTGEALDQQRVGIVYTGDRTSGSLLLRNYYVWRDFSNKLPFQSGGAVDLQRFFSDG